MHGYTPERGMRADRNAEWQWASSSDGTDMPLISDNDPFGPDTILENLFDGEPMSLPQDMAAYQLPSPVSPPTLQAMRSSRDPMFGDVWMGAAPAAQPNIASIQPWAADLFAPPATIDPSVFAAGSASISPMPTDVSSMWADFFGAGMIVSEHSMSDGIYGHAASAAVVPTAGHYNVAAAEGRSATRNTHRHAPVIGRRRIAAACRSMQNAPRRRNLPGRTARMGAAGDRRFQCPFEDCGMFFGRMEHLDRHKRTHTGERPFMCTFPGCGKLFSRRDNLRQHDRVHYRKDKHGRRIHPQLEAGFQASMMLVPAEFALFASMPDSVVSPVADSDAQQETSGETERLGSEYSVPTYFAPEAGNDAPMLRDIRPNTSRMPPALAELYARFNIPVPSDNSSESEDESGASQDELSARCAHMTLTPRRPRRDHS